MNTALQALLNVLDLGWEELELGLDGIADENVWKRPSTALLSVGEIVGHIVFWEAVTLAGAGPVMNPDLSQLQVVGPLVDIAFHNYEDRLANPVHACLGMTASELRSEAIRTHTAVLEVIRAECTDANQVMGRWPDRTWGRMLRYMSFHVAYHAGQIYSARLSLGEHPPGN